MPSRWFCSVRGGRLGRPLIRKTPSSNLDDVSGLFRPQVGVIGIRRGTRTILMVRRFGVFRPHLLLVFKLSARASVWWIPGMGVRNLGKCLAEAEPAGLLESQRPLGAAAAGWPRPTLRITVTVGQPRLGSQFVLDRVPREITLRQAVPAPYPRFRTTKPTKQRQFCSRAAAPAWPKARCIRTVTSPPRLEANPTDV